jgi:hypothetical protein
MGWMTGVLFLVGSHPGSYPLCAGDFPRGKKDGSEADQCSTDSVSVTMCVCVCVCVCVCGALLALPLYTFMARCSDTGATLPISLR